MDPDDALKEIRNILNDDNLDPDDAIHMVFDLFTGLDAWLSSGAALPKDWERTK